MKHRGPLIAASILALALLTHAWRATCPPGWLRLTGFSLSACALTWWLSRRAGTPLANLLQWRSLPGSALVFAGACGAIFIPYVLLAHLVLTHGLHWSLHPGALWWPTFTTWSVQLLAVALPEELFFRGYLFGLLHHPGPRIDWHTVVITALLFAATHSLIAVQWWHFAIFFPGLLFGALRASTGSLWASLAAHAVSNVLMQWMATNYGNLG